MIGGALKGSAPRVFGSPDQARDADGKFASGGGGSTAGATTAKTGERVGHELDLNSIGSKLAKRVMRNAAKAGKPMYGEATAYGWNFGWSHRNGWNDAIKVNPDGTAVRVLGTRS